MMTITTSNPCNCDTGLIEISGLCDSNSVTEVLNTNPYWQQQYISENLTVPAQKPDIEQINSIDVSVSVTRKAVIRTPRSYTNATPPVADPNFEGKLLTGRKLIIEGEICQKIVYTAENLTQPLHSVEFFIPFSSYIVVPREITVTDAAGNGTVVDTLNVSFSVSACVEDVYARLIDPRTIFKEVVLLLYAVPAQIL